MAKALPAGLRHTVEPIPGVVTVADKFGAICHGLQDGLTCARAGPELQTDESCVCFRPVSFSLAVCHVFLLFSCRGWLLAFRSFIIAWGTPFCQAPKLTFFEGILLPLKMPFNYHFVFFLSFGLRSGSCCRRGGHLLSFGPVSGRILNYIYLHWRDYVNINNIKIGVDFWFCVGKNENQGKSCDFWG